MPSTHRACSPPVGSVISRFQQGPGFKVTAAAAASCAAECNVSSEALESERCKVFSGLLC